MTTIQVLADEWLRIDKDPETRQEITDLVRAGDQNELELRLRGRISFGTAGLRARMEAGFTRMNSLTVIQASQGLAAYILSQSPIAKVQGVVIGHDARFNSIKFAKLATAAFVAKGIKVYLFEENVHTPLVPFTVAEKNAAAGVMVTASHNPAQDNGYKVYWSNACQIIPPHDKGIAEAISLNLEPVSWDLDVIEEDGGLVESVLTEMESLYYKSVQGLVGSIVDLPSFVYTPMHGVGLPFLGKAIQFLTGVGESAANESLPFTIVLEQAQPDPTFPTVRFPNPEEAGALDLAISTADKHSIPLIVATDPDADRLAIAERLESGQWHQYTGNQVGILLASHVLEIHNKESRSKMAMLCSTVSSGMLRAMATAEGFRFVETLTGFKWLGNVAKGLHENDELEVPFAFEEALGYMFTSVGYDKDGVCAAAVFLAATANWKRDLGMTPWQRLQSLYEKYGYFAEANTYLISPSPNVTNTIFSQIRAAASPYPTHIGTSRILRWRDLTTGYDSGTQNNEPDLPVDAKSQMITCEVESGIRFTIRGSGTEPKIKLYIEASAQTMAEAQNKANDTQRLLIGEWFKPSQNGLKQA